jgi:hypothetical protein
MILRYGDIVHFLPGIARGRVVDARSGKPVGKVHIVVVAGEEEDFTNPNGEFNIKTGRRFPFDVTVEHQGYRRQSVRFSQDNEPVIIALQPE